jgi:hypothetical protein
MELQEQNHNIKSAAHVFFLKSPFRPRVDICLVTVVSWHVHVIELCVQIYVDV